MQIAPAPTTTAEDRLLFLGWVGVFAAPLFLDYVLDRRHAGLTFSETTRAVLRDIPFGDKIFVLGATGGYGWYLQHILRKL